MKLPDRVRSFVRHRSTESRRLCCRGIFIDDFFNFSRTGRALRISKRPAMSSSYTSCPTFQVSPLDPQNWASCRVTALSKVSYSEQNSSALALFPRGQGAIPKLHKGDLAATLIQSADWLRSDPNTLATVPDVSKRNRLSKCSTNTRAVGKQLRPGIGLDC